MAMTEYEKRKLLLDAVLAIAKETELDFSDDGRVLDIIGYADYLLEQMEQFIK